jgi:prophage regulatory protein
MRIAAVSTLEALGYTFRNSCWQPPNNDGAANPSTDRFLTKPDVRRMTGLSDATIWREYRAGRFPRPHQLTKKRIGWLEGEVQAWMRERAGGALPACLGPRRREQQRQASAF